MYKKFKKIWNAITGVIVAIVVALAIAIVGVRLFGVDVYAVTSGSMEPTLPVGSLIYVKETSFENIKAGPEGDIITFKLSGDTVATHRAIEKDEAAQTIKTKGDNNAEADGAPVMSGNVLGVVKAHIPLLGYVADYVQNPPGTYVSIAGAAFILLLLCIPDLFEPTKKKVKETGTESGKDGNGEDKEPEKADTAAADTADSDNGSGEN